MIEKLFPLKRILKRFIPKKLRGELRAELERRMLMRAEAEHRAAESRPWGVNLYGELSGASGLAEASRSIQLGLERAGIPFCARDIMTRSGQELLAPYAVNLIHTNPDHLPELFYRIPKEQWRAGRNMGFWLWEQERLPEEWLRFLPLFDEIWTSSEFCASAIRASCALPVTVIPHIVEPAYDAACDRAALGLPEDIFLFLVMFDCHSIVERKNPWGAIQAFLKAFGAGKSRAGLVIKARNLDDESRSAIWRMLEGYPHVWLLEGDYSKRQVNSLIRAADVYVSLHRAEGFGLVPAEAMYLGTPVIATNWSANTEFMNEDTACLVDAELVRLEKDILPYRKGSRWAQPNLEQAAGYMRRLYEDEEYRAGLTQRAGVYIRERLSTERIAQLLSARLTEIKRELDGHVIPDADDPLL